MLRIRLLIAIIIFSLNPVQQLFAADTPVPLKKGMVISSSVTIKKGTYQLDAPPSMDESVIIVKGDNIVIDFNGAVLQGSTGISRPDGFFGVAVKILAGKHITIKNAVIRGYKIAILGDEVRGLTLKNCNLSYNYRQHLNSNRQREDLSDWQSYHNNENDEWMRFGAAIYLRDCDSATIMDNLVTGGQCALMMTKCDYGLIYNNNFSFNSGIGIGLYRSSYNKVMNNKLDWNIRGVSYGVYYRGQDAAAILVYEQSSHNVFAYNSATHSGDGFFLWAGRSTLNTGRGGCNDNLIYGNDFSYAPTNGIEATFSSNKIVNNTVVGCAYGVWAGFSHHTLILGNTFEDNTTGIGIEHGQYNKIQGNVFKGAETGINLWAVPGRDMEGLFDQKRDVRSMRYQVENNSFSGVQTVFAIRNSEDIVLRNNKIHDSEQFIRLDTTAEDILIAQNGRRVNLSDSFAGVVKNYAPEPLPDARNAMLPADHRKGKRYIMMTEWGPYDFRSPILWWTKTDSSGTLHFDILGPDGRWTVKKTVGVSRLSDSVGAVPGKLTVDKKAGDRIEIELEYTGKAVVSPFGKKYPAGSTYTFGYKKIDFPTIWEVKSFSFNEKTDPVQKPKAFGNMLQATEPVETLALKDLSLNWWNGLGKKAEDSIATVASGRIHFPKGRYVIGISAGDIVRVYVDGRPVIDAWDPDKLVHNADYHHKAILPLKGWHTIRIEQAQYGGYGMLYFTIKQAGEIN